MLECQWVDNNTDIRVDDYGFPLVNFNKEGHRDELFILISQAKQVFYIKDPSKPNWSIVLTHKQTKFDTFDVCVTILRRPRPLEKV